MKPTNYHLEIQENPNEEDTLVLFAGINMEAKIKRHVEKPVKTFGIFIKDLDKQVIGGVTGATFYGCLHIDMLFVNKKKRHQGLGKKLMIEAENLGILRKCTFVTVNTMDFEALIFYQKLGFEIEYVREGFEEKSKMYLLKKNL
jgi:ribosomal protein S18 acetylase RimI-like enzyme